MVSAEGAALMPRAPRGARGTTTAFAAAGAAAAARTPLMVKLVCLTIMVLPLKFYAGSMVMSTNRVFLLIVILPLLVRLLSGAAGRFRIMDAGALAFTFWSSLTTFYHEGNAAIQFVGSTGVEFLGGYLVGRVCVRNLDQFVAFSKFFGILILCTLPFAIYEAFTGDPIILTLLGKVPGFFANKEFSDAPRLGLFRAQVTVHTAIHYGMISALAFSTVVVGLHNVWDLQRRLLMGAGIFLCCFLSLSSGAFLAIILQLGLVGWSVVMAGNPNRWLLLTILIAIAYTVVEVLSDRDAITVFLAYATFSPTTAMWRKLIFQYGMDNVWMHPFFGIGPKGNWVRPYWMFTASVDNFWLLTAMRHGIPAFLALFVPWIITLWRIGRLRIEEGSDFYWTRRGYMFVMLGLTFSMSTVHVWADPLTLVYCVIGMSAVFLTEAESRGLVPSAKAGPVRPGAARIPAARPVAAAAAAAPGAGQGSAPGPAGGPSGGPSGGPVYTRFPRKVSRSDPGPVS